MVESDALFLSLVQAHGPRLCCFILKNIGRSSNAQDLAQQAFMDAVRSYQSFKGQSELSAWLFGIAMNLVRKQLPPGQALEQSQHLQHLQLAMQALPESLRSILLMLAVDELSYEAAAALLTLPLGAVRSRLAGTRTALRAKLQARGVAPDF
jgi:RNA polymerase sigma-70 factor (ECF subfamily)